MIATTDIMRKLGVIEIETVSNEMTEIATAGIKEKLGEIVTANTKEK